MCASRTNGSDGNPAPLAADIRFTRNEPIVPSTPVCMLKSASRNDQNRCLPKSYFFLARVQHGNLAGVLTRWEIAQTNC